MIHGLRPRTLAALSLVAASLVWSGTLHAQKVNCANEFRSGKLYFSQNIFDKAVDRFAVAVEVCPEKSEYRARYAIALAQFASERLVYIPTLEDDPKAALTDSVETMFAMAGSEFDSAMAQEDANKKIQKLVRESRKHFWVDRYNRGIKLNEDKDFPLADLNFRLARLVDASDPRAFSQGAIALIQMGDKTAAADLVQQGLELFADDEKLNSLQKSIFLDAAEELTKAGEKEKSLEKADEALKYLAQVEAKLDAPDADLLFKKGLAQMAAGGALGKPAGDTPPDTAESVARYREAAESFVEAAKLIPFSPDPVKDPVKEEERVGNNDFHLACQFNRIQSLWYAEDWDGTIAAIKGYIGLKYDDAAIWTIWTYCLQTQKKSDQAAAAIMVSKSLPASPNSKDPGGTEISVEDARKNAKEDAAAALKELGPPDHDYSYQTADGYQVDTWFWLAKRLAMSFVLGVKNGEMAW
jgi:tetratricopeptide (TPR) repeat protein